MTPTPEEKAWLAKAKRLMAQMPPTIHLFTNGTLTAVQVEPGGQLRRDATGNVLGEYSLDTLTERCEGGDW